MEAYPSEGAAEPEGAPSNDAAAIGSEGFDDAVRDLARWASAELGKSEVAPAPAPSVAAPASRGDLFAPPSRSHTALWVAAAIAALIAGGVVAAVLLSGAAAPSAPEQRVDPAEQLAGARTDPGQQLAPSPAPGAAALTPEALRKALDDNKRALQGCIDSESPGLVVRKLRIATTVAPSGAVLTARIDDRALDQSALGDCLKRAAQRIAFPRFAGDPFDVDIPILVAGAE
jgi:hypothetical protein